MYVCISKLLFEDLNKETWYDGSSKNLEPGELGFEASLQPPTVHDFDPIT